MVKAEAENPILPRQLRLARQHVRAGRVIKSEIGGQPRLIVSGKARNRLGYIGPFGEAGAPPLIVLRNGMELRQVKRNQLDERIFGRREGLLMLLMVRTAADIDGNLFQQIQGNDSSCRGCESIYRSARSA